MKHAVSAALAALEPLLANLRALSGLVERSRGVFYRKGRGFLHFHEDPEGLFADLRDPGGQDFERFNGTDESGRAELLAAARARLSPQSAHDRGHR